MSAYQREESRQLGVIGAEGVREGPKGVFTGGHPWEPKFSKPLFLLR